LAAKRIRSSIIAGGTGEWVTELNLMVRGKGKWVYQGTGENSRLESRNK